MYKAGIWITIAVGLTIAAGYSYFHVRSESTTLQNSGSTAATPPAGGKEKPDHGAFKERFQPSPP